MDCCHRIIILVYRCSFPGNYDFSNFYVPSVLLSGNHAKIKNWRRAKSIEKTLSNRPDLLTYDNLSSDDKKLLENLKQIMNTFDVPLIEG